MNEDVKRHITQAEEAVHLWSQHKESLISSAKGEDVQALANAGMNSFSFFYSAKYSKWNFERYLKYPGQYQVDFSITKTLQDLLVVLKSVEDESKDVWHLVEKKLKKSSSKTEWKKYLTILELKYGSTSYAVDLGSIQSSKI